MASTDTKINKQGAAGTIRDITLTILETRKIIRKPGFDTSQSNIMAAYDNGSLTNYGIKKTRKKIPVTT